MIELVNYVNLNADAELNLDADAEQAELFWNNVIFT